MTRTVRLGLVVAIVVLLVDQLTKWWILEHVMQPPRVIEITPFFNLVMAWNRGVSFGMFAYGADMMPYALSVLALGIVCLLFNWMRKLDRGWPAAALGLVIGGAVANVIDRLRFGAVADFLDFHVGGYHWPAFNVADSGIVIGVLLLLIDSVWGRDTAAIHAVDKKRG